MKPMKIACVCLALFLLPLPVASDQSSTAARISLFKPGAIRALILTGQNNHDWRATTPVLCRLLLKTGRFDTRVNEEPAGMTSETLGPYDVVILNYNGPRLGQVAEKALENFAHSGHGLVGVHGANWAFGGLVVLGENHRPTDILEPPWAEYKLMIGGVWSEQPPPSGHAPRHKFVVKIVDPNNPITAGIDSPFEADDELYHNLHMAPDAHILATAYDDLRNRPEPAAGKGPDSSSQGTASSPAPGKWPHLDMNPTGKDEPVLWTVRYGTGRTFYTALGHDVKAMEMPGFATTFVRGVEWAATGSVK